MFVRPFRWLKSACGLAEVNAEARRADWSDLLLLLIECFASLAGDARIGRAKLLVRMVPLVVEASRNWTTPPGKRERSLLTSFSTRAREGALVAGVGFANWSEPTFDAQTLLHSDDRHAAAQLLSAVDLLISGARDLPMK